MTAREDVEALADLIDAAERGLAPGSNDTDARTPVRRQTRKPDSWNGLGYIEPTHRDTTEYPQRSDMEVILTNEERETLAANLRQNLGYAVNPVFVETFSALVAGIVAARLAAVDALAQREAERAEDLADDHAASVAHDLRAILNASPSSVVSGMTLAERIAATPPPIGVRGYLQPPRAVVRADPPEARIHCDECRDAGPTTF